MGIYNISDYAWNYKYMVFRLCDGKAWFFSAWNDYAEACKQARENDGGVIETAHVLEAEF